MSHFFSQIIQFLKVFCLPIYDLTQTNAMKLKAVALLCNICGSTVFKDMKRHIERIHGSEEGIERKKVHCEMCEKTFSDGNNMRVHMKQVHSGRKDEKCEVCSYATYSKYNLKLHVSKVHLGTGLVKQSCPHCDKENIIYSPKAQSEHNGQ